jgi:hypothetical protein
MSGTWSEVPPAPDFRVPFLSYVHPVEYLLHNDPRYVLILGVAPPHEKNHLLAANHPAYLFICNLQSEIL